MTESKKKLIQNLEKQVEIKEENGDWFVYCRKDYKNILPYRWDLLPDEVNKALQNCHG